MKQFILFSILLFTAIYSNATILRCNNNPGITGTNIYTTLQAAYDAANGMYPYDTIHLEPSATSYGNLTISKTIVLISTGTFLTQNTGLQANTNAGFCGDIIIDNFGGGSTISANTGNISINGAYGINIVNTHCTNIYAYEAMPSPPPNWFSTSFFVYISKCFISGNVDLSYSSYQYGYGGNNSATLNNNIIIGNLNLQNSGFITTPGNFTAKNNTFMGSFGIAFFSGSYFNTLDVQNNIFAYAFNNFGDPSQNIYSPYLIPFQNNICSSALSGTSNNPVDLPDGNGNVGSVNMATVFENWGTFNGDNYQLKTAYPNQNVGAFSGTTPYKLSCIPSIPSIYNLQVPTTVQGNMLNVIISTRSND